MKKFLSRLLALMLAVIIFAFSAMAAYGTSASGGQLQLAVSFGAQSVKSGNTVDVTVSCKNETAENITDISFVFGFDSGKISPVSGGYTVTPAKAAVEFSGSTAKVSYAATGASDCPAIAPGQSISVVFKMQVVSGLTEDQSAQFTLSGASAIKRRNISSPSVAADNIAYTFTFGAMPAASLSVYGYSHNADLASLMPIVDDEQIEMTPAFSSDVTEYYIIVENTVPNFKFTWAKAEQNASVQYVPPEGNTLQVGENTFRFVVTAEDRTTTKTYTAVVRRLKVGETPTDFADGNTEQSGGEISGESDDLDITEDEDKIVYSDDELEKDGYLGEEIGFGGNVSLKLSTLLIIVGGVVLLFILAFFGGYSTHKNASKPPQYTIEDIVSAQQYLELQNMREEVAALPQPQPLPALGDGYIDEGLQYEPYPETDMYNDYSQPGMYELYPQTEMYEGYPQLDEYSSTLSYQPLEDDGGVIEYEGSDEYYE